jgi:hypothetical protein
MRWVHVLVSVIWLSTHTVELVVVVIFRCFFRLATIKPHIHLALNNNRQTLLFLLF